MGEEVAGEFHELLFNVFENVWLVHCLHKGPKLEVGVLVTESGIEDVWHLCSDGMGAELYVRLPEELLRQGSRYLAKGVTLQCRPVTPATSHS